MPESYRFTDQSTALLALCVTAVMWASSFPAAKAALADYTPGEVVLLRLLAAGMCFVLVLVPLGRARPRRWTDLPVMGLLGVLGIFGYLTLLTSGQQSITASAAGLVITAIPIFTSLLAAIIAGERLRWLGWLGLALGAIGVTVITLNEGLDLGSVRGVGLVIVAALASAFYFVLQKSVLRREAPVTFLAWAVWISIVPALWAGGALAERIATASLEATLATIYLGIFPMVIGYGCYTFALSHLPASLASSFIYLQPPISVLIAWAWLGEEPTGLIFVGGGLALVGVALVTRFGVPRARR